jgi:YHS domain-containing protein
MLRLALLLVLLALLARAFWRVIDGVIEGARGEPSAARTRRGGPVRGVQMAKDPICGTYVVPERAVLLTVGDERHFFCSVRCRDAFRARTA